MPHKDPEAAKAYRRRYYEQNKAWKWKNPDGTWKTRPKELIREQRRRRYHEDPEFRAKHQADQKRRQAAKRRTGTCPICGTPGVRLVWDHDHKTGEFRGWICSPCNLTLGHAHDSVMTLTEALVYVANGGPRHRGETLMDIWASAPK